jgi:hypothetical protein
MASTVNGWTVGYTAVGGVLLWSGLKGTTISATVRSVLAGQAPSGDTETIGTPTVSETSPTSATSSATATGGTASPSAAANQATAKLLAQPYGWSTGAEWAALVALWQGESGWSTTAKNPTSGAYGIPQSYPASKMPAAALPPTNSASAQISWGLAYIKSTYGDPIAAEAFDVANGGY